MDFTIFLESLCSLFLRGQTILRINACVLSIFLIVSAPLANAQVQFQNTTSLTGGPFHTGESWGASWGHINSDVYPDLFVSNHAMKSSLLLNNGDGTFSEQIDIADLDGALTSTSGVKGDIHGGAWADFDNDGDQDLFVTKSSSGSTLFLFKNNGQGLFTEQRQTFGTGAIGGARMPMLFDYNHDGRLDLAVSGNEGNDLFRWNGFRFVDQSFAQGVYGKCLGGHSLGASDFFPDDTPGSPIKPIYFCNSPAKNVETAYDTSTDPFTDVTSKFDIVGTTPDTILADFNNDLKMDMFTLRGNRVNNGVAKISNNRIEAWLAEWSGNTNYTTSFTFSASGPITINLYARTTDDPSRVYIGGTSGVSSSGYQPSSIPFTLSPNDSRNWGNDSRYSPDYHKPGVHIEFDEPTQKWTIIMSGWAGGDGAYFKIDGSGFSNPVATGLTSSDLSVTPAFLLNNGSRLVNSGARGIGAVMCGGTAAADFDNDMDVDLYLTCKSAVGNIENRLYLNNGNGSFSFDSSTGAEGLIGKGMDSGVGAAEGATTADYDVDGFMDLFVTNGNRLFPHFHKDGFTAGGPDQFYRNISNNGNKWLQVDLIGNGADTNRDAFGAKVIVTAGGVSQLREQNGQFHRWSHDHKRLHFGLASNNTANIEIRWPNGDIDNHTGVSANKLYQATQNGLLTDITPSGGNQSPTLGINSVSLTEGSSAEVTVSLSSASASAVTVNYQTNPQTATSGDDYVFTSGTLTFTPGQTVKTISVPSVQDDADEGNETLSITLSNALGASIGQSTAIITIIDDDTSTGGNSCGQPTYSLSNISDRGLYVYQDCNNLNLWSVRGIAGGGSSAAFEGAVDSSEALASIVPVSLESTDSAVLSNSSKTINYSMRTGGAWQDGFNFTATDGADLCFSLNITGQPIYYGVNAQTVTSPVNLNDTLEDCVGGVSLPTITIEEVSVSEGNSAQVTVSLSSASASPVTVSYQTDAQTATSGDDYVYSSGMLTFSSGQTVKTISVTTVQDSLIEGDETLAITLSNASGASIGQSSGVITINDDATTGGNECGQPTYSLSNINDRGLYIYQDCNDPNQWSVRGIAGGGSSALFVGTVDSSQTLGPIVPVSLESSDSAVLSNGSNAINYSMTSGGPWQDGFNFTATSGADLCLSMNDGGLPIYYGVNAVAVTSPVNLIDTIAVCGGGGSSPIIIVNDISVSESIGDANIMVSLSTVWSDTVTVSYSTANDTATEGLDYSAASGIFTFQPGETSKTLSIPIISDAIAEGSEQFNLVLSDPVNALMPDSQGIVTITESGGSNTSMCGQPTFSASSDAGLFIWKDCGGTESWYFTASGGGLSWVRFDGSISTSSPMSSVVAIGLESSDSYQLSNGDQTLDYIMSTGGAWTDSLKFNLDVSADICVNTTSNMSVPVIVGAANSVVTPPFSLNTLGACQ